MTFDKGSIITHLCLKGGVTFDKDEEEKCPIVSHLTLTAITKNPISKGKKKLNEIEEERGDKEVEMNINEPSNQAMVARKEQTKNEKEISESPDWVMTLESKSLSDS